MKSQAGASRRRFLATATMATGAALLARRSGWAIGTIDPKVSGIVANMIGIDTHNHVDLPLTAAEMPGPDIDLVGEMKRSGLSAICMTFATDYQQGDAYDRFLKGLEAADHQLKRSGVRRSLSVSDIRTAHKQQQPTVVQSVEGGHFLQGRVERVEEAYGRGLRHLGLLHDSDATVALGDVYTNTPKYGGLTAFGASVIKECNRLGMLIDLAHADTKTTEAALRLSTRPVIISHTGLDTQLGDNPRIAQMMRPRLISKEQATMVAKAGGLVGVWTHLADTPLAFAQNLRAMADVIGIDHVCIGTDTKLTQPAPRGPGGPPPGGGPPGGPKPDGSQGGPSQGGVGDGMPGGPRPGPQGARAGERTNYAWNGQTEGFLYVVVDAMLKTGFTADEIAKIGGGNYLRIFGQAVKA
ncbi:dipeptidase [Terriglobus roseus]|uniref:Zn-dependent dipeptidase, dipeptidase homolog n=1 Tax=Terriglobus roseus TaxID=392734 RepID=A0A1H4R5P9_9BACT|nr:membrane dipeptidase [Terriglobus roseus]SEC27064.1 Zn-dependent dipeptidase, dipeptidase homolog [Terriglobus roseus]